MRNVLLILGVCFSCLLNAQTFEAKVDRNPIGLNEQFSLTLSLPSRPASLKLPKIDGLNKLGVSQSMQTNIVNGKVSSSFNYIITYQATKLGKVTIPAIEAEVDNKTYSSSPFRITIQEEATKQRRTRNDPFSSLFDDDPFGFSRMKQRSPSISGTWEDNVFFRLIPSKREVFVGEKIRLTLQLYFHPDIVVRDYNLMGFETNGFIVEELQTNQKIELETKRISDKTFNFVTLGYLDVYPQIAGETEINPANMSCIASIGYYNRNRLDLESNRIKIKVEALPNPKPAGFTGYVGDLRINRTISDTLMDINTGGNITYSFKGSGNLDVINMDGPNLPADFQVFEEELSSGSNSRTIRYPYVARNGGNYTLPKQQLSYFNPVREQYVKVKFPETSIRVIGTSSRANAYQISDSSVLNNQGKGLNQDIRFIKTNSSSSYTPSVLSYRPVMFSLAGLSILALMFPILKNRFETFKESRTTPFSKALLDLENGKQADTVLYNYLSEKTGQPLSTINAKFLQQALLDKGEQQLAQQFNDWLSTYQYAQFAGQSQSNSNIETLRSLLHETDSVL